MICNYKHAEKIILVDLSNLANVCYHGYRKAIQSDMPVSHVYGFFAQMATMLQKSAKQRTAMVFALDGYPRRKHELYSEYKATRKKRTDDDFNPKPDVKQMVRYFKGTVLYNKDEEADDIMAAFIERNQAKGVTIDIISTDNDMFQLLGRTGIRQYSTLLKRYVNKSDLEDKYGLNDWHKLILWKALFGDSSDNIKPAFPRLPKKQFVPIINESDGTVEDFLLRTKTLAVTEKVNEKLNDKENLDRLGMNYNIVKLNENIGYDEENSNGNKRFLDTFLKTFKCFSLLEDTELMTGV